MAAGMDAQASSVRLGPHRPLGALPKVLCDLDRGMPLDLSSKPMRLLRITDVLEWKGLRVSKEGKQKAGGGPPSCQLRLTCGYPLAEPGLRRGAKCSVHGAAVQQHEG